MRNLILFFLCLVSLGLQAQIPSIGFNAVEGQEITASGAGIEIINPSGNTINLDITDTDSEGNSLAGVSGTSQITSINHQYFTCDGTFRHGVDDIVAEIVITTNSAVTWVHYILLKKPSGADADWNDPSHIVYKSYTGSDLISNGSGNVPLGAILPTLFNAGAANMSATYGEYQGGKTIAVRTTGSFRVNRPVIVTSTATGISTQFGAYPQVSYASMLDDIPASGNENDLPESFDIDGSYFILGLPKVTKGISVWGGEAFLYENYDFTSATFSSSTDLQFIVDLGPYNVFAGSELGKRVQVRESETTGEVVCVISAPALPLGDATQGAIYEITDPTGTPTVFSFPEGGNEYLLIRQDSLVFNVSSGIDVQEMNDPTVSYDFLNVSGCVSLPVELTSFTGTAGEGQNYLKWATVSETNNEGFYLQSSTDGRTFEEITFIDGAGNSSYKVDYSYTDREPFEVTYYRLEQIDFDGTSTFSPVIVVRQKPKTSSLRVWPNPAKTYFQTSQSGQLFSLTGQLIMEIQGNREIDISDLPAGTYFIRSKEEVQKLIIQ